MLNFYGLNLVQKRKLAGKLSVFITENNGEL